MLSVKDEDVFNVDLVVFGPRLFSGELHRIRVCYGSRNGDDTFTFSDDQSSCQVLVSIYSRVCFT